jgi:hypothetical protein
MGIRPGTADHLCADRNNQRSHGPMCRGRKRMYILLSAARARIIDVREGGSRRGRHYQSEPLALTQDRRNTLDLPMGAVRHVPRAPSLREAIKWTIAYSSIFDFPLTSDEVYRFLVAPGGSRADVDAAIEDELRHGTDIETDGQFLYPAGQSALVATRLRRSVHAGQAWKQARFYAWLIWMLPYVRMVGVTGSLAMNNVEEGGDIDLMIVTEPARLWMTRGMILIIVRLARACGHVVCPNYFISLRALAIPEQNLYTAHELVQLTPIHGRNAVQRLWAKNAWCREFLPNADWQGDARIHDSHPRILIALKAVAEVVLRLPIGTWIEQWERRRKIAKLLRSAPRSKRETRYTADVCKGHVDGHANRVMSSWMARVEWQVEITDPQP